MMDLPWPKKGDHPFKVDSSNFSPSTWGRLDWLANIDFDDAMLSEAFKTVADKAIAELKRGDDFPRADTLFIPIAYLYRHSIELKLKALIRIGIKLELEELTEKTEKCLKGHKLLKLWEVAKRFLKAEWPDGSKEDLNAAETIINDFQKIDRSGQYLRYSKTIEGNPTLPSLRKLVVEDAVDLVHLQEIFERFYNFLDACHMGFSVALDNLNEMRSDWSSGV